ncbi:hypothetical protein DFS33DRAFT_1489387 [Desarmillaria ectypa]|nr:hypothetical protein DFS33DRAFT_1489387 [Desarmillaria ectypa]
MSYVHCNESDINTLSTLSENFKNSILEKIRSSTPTLSFIVQAEQHISSLHASRNIERNLDRPSTVDKDIHPDAVLDAMLANATGDNDDNSHTPRRYVACAITTAGHDNNFEQLIELANTWVRYLFWPFKANKGDLRDLHSASEIAAPTLRETETLNFKGSRSRLESFKDAVKERDNYRCIVTRAMDARREHARPPTTVIEAAHIFKRAVAAGKRDKTSLAEYATWDILRHFIALSEEEVADLDANIDYIFNGITLDRTLHSFFDNFWCSLCPDPDQLNQYHLELFIAAPLSVYGRDIEVISFERCPAELRPSRKLVQFHYSLAKVLHASGAGEIIETMLKRFYEGGRKPVIVSTDDLELLLSIERMSLVTF